MQEISSQTIGQISEALAKAQGLIENALKDSANPFFKSHYASLGAVMEACKKPLSDNHLSFSSSVISSDSGNLLVGTLSHSSGEWLRTYIPLIMSKHDMQTLGAAVSYARRFALASLVHVGVEDDDAESVVGRGNGQPAKVTSSDSHPLTEKQRSFLKSLVEQADDPDQLSKMCDHYKVKDIFDITSKDFDTVLKALQKKIQAKGASDAKV